MSNEIGQALRRTQLRQYYRWQMEARARAFIAAEVTQVLAPIDGRPAPDEPTALVLPAVQSPHIPDRYETRPMKTIKLPEVQR